MNKLARYIIIIAITAIVLAVVWYFQNIVAYVLISVVLSLIGKPLMHLLCSVKYSKFYLPRAVCSTLTLLTLWLVAIVFFCIFIPLILEQINEFSKIDVIKLTEVIDAPLHQLDCIAQKYLSVEKDFSIKELILQQIEKAVNLPQIRELFGSMAGLIKNLAIALFAISFITFFFLKEDNLFLGSITLLFPQRYEQNLSNAMQAVNRLLVRYFIGIFTDILCVMTLLTLGLTFIAGYSLQQALLLGLIAGILNVIPYVGPLTGYALGTLMCIVTVSNTSAAFLPLEIKTIAVFFTVQLLDMGVFQPFIYSNSIKAHPLEIFLVILIAGSLFGILGMLIAIPTYTVIRVFAKEFFNKFRVVQKLTEKI
ncbi:MAG: AI-2E family transporter [Bacteroidales bacterium]